MPSRLLALALAVEVVASYDGRSDIAKASKYSSQ
jgi:hypothetical protein